MQYRRSQDECEKEPVGNIDMRLLALDQRADEHHEVRNPDDFDEDVCGPFHLGILAPLAIAQHIAQRRQYNNQLPAPEREAGESIAKQARLASALNYVIGGSK